MLLLVYAYTADLIFGDPEWLPHPVRGMGKLISAGEKILWKKESKNKQRLNGLILTMSVIFITAISTYMLLLVLQKINPILRDFFAVYIGYTTIAVKDLRIKSKTIYFSLKKNMLYKARRDLSKIVGRDTENLKGEEIIKATVESVSENTNDGIIAPLFYLILGGPILAISYKAINTLDSMVGYKNERYINFGWASAKLDDIVNYIPARISGFLISISSFISGKDFKGSFKIMLRDSQKHPSPNSGISEAAMAGALGIRLGGAHSYQGRVRETPYIGEETGTVKLSLIKDSLMISLIASMLMVSIGVILKCLI